MIPVEKASVAEPAAAILSRLPPVPLDGKLSGHRTRAGNETFKIGGLLLLSRISCFLAIALGIVSLLTAWTGQTGGAVRILLVSPNEALGLIFVGFAVRMSRLENHRLPIRIIVKTSRICLGLLGVSALFGLDAVAFTSSTLHGTGGGSSLAVGVFYLLIAAVLMLKSMHKANSVRTLLTAMICFFLASCWIAVFLSACGLASIPEILRIELLPLMILSGVSSVLTRSNKIPGILKVFSESGPEAEAARVLFPLAFTIPLVLAILRHRAESEGLLQRDLGLLLHVLLSAGSMALMIIWNANRISTAARILESTQRVIDEIELQYHAIFEVFTDPVWVFSPKGQLIYENPAAREFSAGQQKSESRPRDLGSVLGAEQQGAVLSAAVFGRQISAIRLFHRGTGALRQLEVKFLKVIHTLHTEPRAIALVARSTPGERVDV